MRNKSPATVTVAVLFGAFLVPWLAASAQETPADDLMTVGHYLDMERVSSPQISPDGSQIVFVRSWVDKQNDQFESAIWIMDADGRRPRFLIEGGNPRWSPNGDRIAYLASGEQGTPQIFVRWMDEEGAVTPVTREHGSALQLPLVAGRLAPLLPALCSAVQALAHRPARGTRGGRMTPPPRIVDRIHYRMDRIGFLEEGFTHLFRVPSEGGTARQLTSGEWNAGATFVPGSRECGL